MATVSLERQRELVVPELLQGADVRCRAMRLRRDFGGVRAFVLAAGVTELSAQPVIG